MTDLIIVDGEAWLPEEWEKRERRRAYDRAYRQRPGRKERSREILQRWRAENLERLRAYNREWMRRHREKVAVASLHDLACTGPTRRTGCVCQKIRISA